MVRDRGSSDYGVSCVAWCGDGGVLPHQENVVEIAIQTRKEIQQGHKHNRLSRVCLINPSVQKFVGCRMLER